VEDNLKYFSESSEKMKGYKPLGLGLLATLLLVITPISAGATYQLGQSCKKGQSAVVTMAVNIRVPLVCTQVGNVWKFTNSDGKLHVTKYVVPVGVAKKPYQLFLPVLGGKPPYRCTLAKGSTLPFGFSYSQAGQVTKGVWNCVIASASVPPFFPGTTKTISPPFTLMFSDASSPIQKTMLTLNITIIDSGPHIEFLAPGSCQVGIFCSVRLATATGGVPPYSFRSDTFINGSPPMGMTIHTEGDFGVLSGTPSVEGVSEVGICVVDSTGSSDCGKIRFQGW
jgi:hypothetical protein